MEKAIAEFFESKGYSKERDNIWSKDVILNTTVGSVNAKFIVEYLGTGSIEDKNNHQTLYQFNKTIKVGCNFLDIQDCYTSQEEFEKFIEVL